MPQSGGRSAAELGDPKNTPAPRPSPPPRDPGGAASEPHSTPLYNPPGAHIEGGYRAIGEEVYTSNGKTENLL